MGRIARLLSFTRTVRDSVFSSDVKVDPGGGENVTGLHFSPAGDDSFPLSTDFVVMVEVQGSGREVVVGYADPLTSPVAVVGEKRIYARDSAGVPVNEVWLKADGEVLIKNTNGRVTLNPDGSIDVSGGTMTISGGDVEADGISLKGHTHNILGGSSAPGPTGPAN